MDTALKLRMHDLMVKSRVLEEQLIAMTRSGDGYFWIGGPGEEALNVPLGLLVQKGEGPAYDYLHLHYRSSGTLMAMGASMLDTIRQMRSVSTDPYSGGRNFVNHYARREWNIVPGTPTIEVQHSMAIGTAWVQKREGGSGLTIVNGGDAGAAEGDFATCLNWASRPGHELPLLIVIAHNHYGISTESATQWHMQDIASRAEPFGIRHAKVDGNDPEVAYAALAEAMGYIRKERRPFCLQASVSRLHGHSSSTGGGRVDERDCLAEFEQKLVAEGVLAPEAAKAVWEKYRGEAKAGLEQARGEPYPDPATLHRHTFYEGEA
ncbi:MAG: thiamine pyrophosphate-dependent dehydrogenase E1 component subunit alpha [Myxococcales bacterium]